MKLTLMQFVTLDGVYQGPGAPDEDTTGGFTRGGWMVPYMDHAFIEQAASWLEQADALLLGRRTYEAFAEAWPNITDPADPFSAAMNGLPKYVASQTLATTPWQPATILKGDVPGEVAKLKEKPGRELQIHGSGSLGRSLLEAGLVDELRLVISPVVVGQGRRLFASEGPALGLRVTSNTTLPGGITVMVLETTGAPEFATYPGVSGIEAG